jgi:hypothetical protein
MRARAVVAADPRGGEFDGQRNAAQALTDLLDRRSRVGSEGRVGVAGSIDRQFDRAAVDARRRYAHDPFAVDIKRFALVARICSRGHRRSVSWAKSAAASRTCSPLSSSSSSVTLSDPVEDRRPGRQAGSRSEPQRGRHERVHVARITAGGQVHQPDTRRVRRAYGRGHRHCEPGLANATGSREHHESGLGEISTDPVDLGGATDQLGYLGRRFPAVTTPCRNAGNSTASPVADICYTCSGPTKSRSSRRPRFHEPDFVDGRLSQKRGGRTARHHLAAMGGLHEPGTAT